MNDTNYIRTIAKVLKDSRDLPFVIDAREEMDFFRDAHQQMAIDGERTVPMVTVAQGPRVLGRTRCRNWRDDEDDKHNAWHELAIALMALGTSEALICVDMVVSGAIMAEYGQGTADEVEALVFIQTQGAQSSTITILPYLREGEAILWQDYTNSVDVDIEILTSPIFEILTNALETVTVEPYSATGLNAPMILKALVERGHQFDLPGLEKNG